MLLSNRVPALPAILSALGIDTRFRAVIDSAASGYEKPHPWAFRLVLEAAGPAHCLVMIGDNPQADAEGSRRAGLDAIWVRRHRHTDTPDLDTAVILLYSTPAPNRRHPASSTAAPQQPGRRCIPGVSSCGSTSRRPRLPPTAV
ncbi:HAD family hydrolase [Streptomyces virginiae]|uniref:HAD family hydrolase n=1 Tax=Streptomyces virginiae TaxID=1961 RepID=UPI00344487C9